MPSDPKIATVADAAPTAFPQTVHDFCVELSDKDKRPEMIYAFSKDEERNGRVRDLAVNFQSRYATFCGR
ncbi:MAG TPA: hypothetical protein DEQ40_08085 [Oxalobacteraceae bacterium]|jgi:hypothetical protein|nr:hypothetical protein [Oxalobacteraceae bacterium]